MQKERKDLPSHSKLQGTNQRKFLYLTQTNNNNIKCKSVELKEEHAVENIICWLVSTQNS